MPIHQEGSGWQWGHHGHVYPTKAGAEKQAAAAHAHGFTGDDPMSTVANAAIPAGLRKKPTLDSEPASQAAGIAFVEPTGSVLLLRRTDANDFGGHWAFPAGGVEDGETPEDAARREAEEELGGTMQGRALKLLDRRQNADGLAFHTFAHAVDAPFQPELNEEHSGYVWAPLDQFPSPLHPGVEATLKDRLGVTADMTPEDWDGLRAGFLKWTLEEEAEPEHANDDLSRYTADATFNESDHPRSSSGEFTSGGGGEPTIHTFKEKGDPRAKPSEHEARMLGIKPKQEHVDYSGKKPISAEALATKLKGMSSEKLHAALKDKNVDPMIRAHVSRELNARLLHGTGDDLENLNDVESVKIKFAGDELLPLAADRDSVRTKDLEGRLHVQWSNISMADVNPYYGREIPEAEELGLDPNRVYQMFRAPEELDNAAPTANGIQILRKHVPINAEDHKPYDVIGATGNDAKFEYPFLGNSLTFWPADDIEDIENDEKKELSCGYRYRAEMTPGVFDGKAYDGIMRDIVFNHVALVENGRAGPEVVVGDSAENLHMSKPTRLAALALQLTAGAVSPLLAKDAQIELPKDLFASITSKNFKDKKSALIAGVKKSLDGKLRPGLAMDASIDHVAEMLDALEHAGEGVDESASQEQHNAMEAAAHGESKLGIPKNVGLEFEKADKGKGFDAEPLTQFLKEKGVSDEDIKKAMDMLPKGADEETEEEKAKREAEEKKAAEDKKARDEELESRPTKEAMDAAIKLACDATATETEKRVRKSMHEIAAALEMVKPLVGHIEPPTMGFDSAEQIHRKALKMLGREDADTVHASALPTVIGVLAEKAQEKAQGGSGQGRVVMDEASAKSLNDRFGIDRIGTA